MNASAAPDNWWPLLEESPECVLTDDASGQRPSLLFAKPTHVISAQAPEAVAGCLSDLDAARRAGLWAAGYLTYNALDSLHGLTFPGNAQDAHEEDSAPLLWFGLFERALVLPPGDFKRVSTAARGRLDYSLGRTRPDDEDREFFLAGVAAVREELARGNCYQVNLTTETVLSFSGSALRLYVYLRRLQPAGHAAFVRHAGRSIVSLSPELFFRLEGANVETRPVKGTAARGDDPESDLTAARRLREDPKTRAENLMITDLLRNDLGACALFGSVEAGPLFAVETLPSLHQMYSVIRGRLAPEFRERLFQSMIPAIYPCGSVTGAPKRAARELIARLEGRRRGVYTGTIGYAAPARDSGRLSREQSRAGELAGLPEAEFSVAIRTLDITGNVARFGTGCGIVWDSRAPAEYAEANLKRSFLWAACNGFALIETMCARRGRVRRLLDHVRRLRRGLRAFGVPPSACRTFLLKLAEVTNANALQEVRLRLLVDRDGVVNLAVSNWTPEPRRHVRLLLSESRIHSTDPFRRHKTTIRGPYDRELARVRALGADDALFLNESGDVVETSIANVLVHLDGAWVTPSVSSGALPGTALAEAVRRRKRRGLARGGATLVQRTHEIERRKIGLREIARAKRVLVCNSVRGFLRVGSITDGHGRNVYFDRGIATAHSGKAGEDA